MSAADCRVCRGACCEEAQFVLEPRDFFDAEWLEARLGPWIARRLAPRVPGGCKVLETCIPIPCPLLTHDGLCSVHDSQGGEQPTACRLAAVNGPECRAAIKRRRPDLWELIRLCFICGHERGDHVGECQAGGTDPCSCHDFEGCSCTDVFECEGHRA